MQETPNMSPYLPITYQYISMSAVWHNTQMKWKIYPVQSLRFTSNIWKETIVFDKKKFNAAWTDMALGQNLQP